MYVHTYYVRMHEVLTIRISAKQENKLIQTRPPHLVQLRCTPYSNSGGLMPEAETLGSNPLRPMARVNFAGSPRGPDHWEARSVSGRGNFIVSLRQRVVSYRTELLGYGGSIHGLDGDRMGVSLGRSALIDGGTRSGCPPSLRLLIRVGVG
ncbi:hypothetical protein BDV28DRAFT_105060 [Aspergillus coremiiformis]|uniref:Uncharacterized protein n=1 Tax=Aspergillus coremiiformis TaxID=138285 RepID=A0A5N6YRZ5_9EURO|nr:hypothetical protein BDV28DRAFT_105060 [Aspergillus coremiiformis]